MKHSAFRIPHSALRGGFTLVEIMLVVIIIGVLAGMVLPRFAGRTEEAKKARARADVAAIGMALDLYELDLGEYPEKLNQLVEQPSGSKEWRGPYLKKGVPPSDPWGTDYHYERSSDKKDYALTSFGPDKKQGEDDIKSSQ